MTIGLDFGQLLDVFGASLAKRRSEIEVEHLTSEMGLNPITKEEMERIQEQYNISGEQTLQYTQFVLAFIDTIVSNNEAISKTLNL